jgi:hypothetical protein
MCANVIARAPTYLTSHVIGSEPCLAEKQPIVCTISLMAFYDELACVFDKFPKHSYHMKILLRNSKVKVCKEDICKPKFVNENLQEIRNNIGVKSSKYYVFKS